MHGKDAAARPEICRNTDTPETRTPRNAAETRVSRTSAVYRIYLVR